jgi:hypothetical protein
MNDCQGRGRVTRQGEKVATVEYFVEPEPEPVNGPIHGQVQIVEGDMRLSPGDQFTLHMEGGLELDCLVEQATDHVKGEYRFKGIGAFRKSA